MNGMGTNRRSRLSGRAILAASVLTLMFLPVSASAVELIRDNFNKIPDTAVGKGFPANIPGREGNGWTQPRPGVSIVHPVSFADVRKGAISFDLKRLPGAPVGRANTVFVLLGPNSEHFFLVGVKWQSEVDPAKSVLIFSNRYEKSFREYGMGLWDPEIVLDRAPAENEWVHFDIVWDDLKKEYALYLDGRMQNVHAGKLDRRLKKVVPDEREQQNREREAKGEPPRFFSNPFAFFLKGVSALQVGYGNKQPTSGQNRIPVLSYAVVDNLVVDGDEFGPVDNVGASGCVVNSLKAFHTMGGVLLLWEAPEVRGVNQSYKVYRKDSLSGALKCLGQTYDISYADPSALKSVDYDYVVRVDYNGGESPVEAKVTAFKDQKAPEPPGRLIAEVPWGGEIKLSWTASPSDDVSFYGIYRSEGAAPLNVAAAPHQTAGALEFVDKDIIAGIRYNYTVVAEDYAGNRSAPADKVSALAVKGDGPAITGFVLDPAGRPLRPGQTLFITMTGQSGGKAVADLEGLAKGIVLAEKGATGGYLGSYQVTDADVAASTARYRLVGNLSDDYGGSRLAGPEVAVIGLDVINDRMPPSIAGVEHDGFKVAGFSGKLVAGDVLTVTLTGEAAGFASFHLVGVADGDQPMAEVSPGLYRGSYTVQWGKEGDKVPVEGALADAAGNTTSLAASATVDIDTRVRIAVTASDSRLPADGQSKTRFAVREKNANGADVPGHELALTLSTTEEYSGVVGGGKVEDKSASKDDVDDLEVRWNGITGRSGELGATYTAGFAAKTALVVAKDLTTGDVGAGWLNTFVSSTLAIELRPMSAKAAATRALLTLSVSPGWLTADGRSKARVRAVLTGDNGTPLKGAKVNFELGNDNGKIRILRGVTDAAGLAEAEYHAGTVAGFVTLVATASAENVSSTVQVELRSDAPAKIGLFASEEILPADGRSRSDIRAVVTDINDNANKKVPVTFAALGGNGSVTPAQGFTDDSGIALGVYTAGKTAGTVLVEARHTSRVPTQEELRRVYGTLFVPRFLPDQEREPVEVLEWLVASGDKVLGGQPLARIGTRNVERTLNAPEEGIFVREVRHKRDRVTLGETIGYLEIAPDVWAAKYVK